MKNNALFRIISSSIITLLISFVFFAIYSCRKNDYYKLPKEVFELFPYEKGDTVQMYSDADTITYITKKRQLEDTWTDVSNIRTHYVYYQEFSLDLEGENTHFSIFIGYNPDWKPNIVIYFSIPSNDTVFYTAFSQDPMEIKYSDSIPVNQAMLDSVYILQDVTNNDSLFIKYRIGMVKMKADGKVYYFNHKK